jgi:histidinol dehydrogenase
MSALNLRQLKTGDAGFDREFAWLLDRAQTADPKIEVTVKEIIADVRARGDAALLEYTRRFDRRDVASVVELEIARSRLRGG